MSTIDYNPWESGNSNNSNNTKSNDSQPNQLQPILKKKVIDFQVSRILGIWPYMVLSSIILFFSGWLYLRYTVNIYQATTSVVLDDNAGLNPGLAGLRDPLNNQIAILKSNTVASRVVLKNKLQYHTFLKGKVKDKELFNEMKWYVSSSISDKREKLVINIFPKNLDNFEWKCDNASGKGKWNLPVMIKGNELFFISYTIFPKNSILECVETDIYAESNKIANSLGIEVKKNSNVLMVSYDDNVPERAALILTDIIPSYNEEAVVSKLKTLQNSLDFIQRRIAPLNDELDSIESAFAVYKSKKILSTADYGGGNVVTQYKELTADLRDIEVQKKTLTSAVEYLSDPLNKDNEIVLTGINDPGLLASIKLFHQLRDKRKLLSESLTENNPRVIDADKKLVEARNLIELQLNSYRNSISILENELEKNKESSIASIRRIPIEEQSILERTRIQNIKQNLYQGLLQKKEEIALNLASVSIHTSILDVPKVPKLPISPKSNEIMIFSVLLGLIIPLLIAAVSEVLNNKVTSKNQLLQLTNTPIIAEIDLAEMNNNDPFVIKEKDRSVIGEQLRVLRANLNFYGSNKHPFYVLVSSVLSGEGKSFMCANMGASFALMGKRTALLEFDMRKPVLSKRFNIKAQIGLSNVLIGEVEPADIIIPIMDTHPLFLFPTGPIPPNPSELLAKDTMLKLKKYLDENFDVIIIDTPPFGLVADAQILEHWSHVNLFMVRFQKTLQEQITEIEDVYQRKVFKNMGIIFNGIKMSGYYGYKYGYYGAKRKYGYSYYNKEISIKGKNI
jgi:capsular exopolysaccharide synthesis family protein